MRCVLLAHCDRTMNFSLNAMVKAASASAAQNTQNNQPRQLLEQSTESCALVTLKRWTPPLKQLTEWGAFVILKQHPPLKQSMEGRALVILKHWTPPLKQLMEWGALVILKHYNIPAQTVQSSALVILKIWNPPLKQCRAVIHSLKKRNVRKVRN